MFVSVCVCLFGLFEEGGLGKGRSGGGGIVMAGGFAGLLVGFFLVVGLVFIF